MLNLNFHIRNPWAKDTFKNLFCFSKLISKHKVFEFEVYKYNYDLIGIDLDLSCSGTDHAGPKLDITLINIVVSIKVYDTRHWDFENKTWMLDV